jgi:5-methyltetrahydrofolate--homocysteine methyltransferase
MSMKSLVDRVRRRERIVGDGAIGTMLIARGLPSGQPPERWTFERPNVVEEVARAYADAGAELITTNSFGGSPIRLRLHGLESRLEDINAGAVLLARGGAEGRAHVIASIGPTGQLLRPLGSLDSGTVSDGFRRQAAALAGAGVDGFIIETMTDIEEAVLAVEAVRVEAPGVPVFATMTFDQTPRGAFTVMGVSVARACARLEQAGAEAIGANCGTGPEAMLGIARQFAETTTLPLIFQPNAGLPQHVSGRLVYPQRPDAFAASLAQLAPHATILGGCCGTTPEHIAALKSVVAG